LDGFLGEDCREYRSEPSGSVRDWVLELLRNYKLLKKDSAQWGWLVMHIDEDGVQKANEIVSQTV